MTRVQCESCGAGEFKFEKGHRKCKYCGAIYKVKGESNPIYTTCGSKIMSYNTADSANWSGSSYVVDTIGWPSSSRIESGYLDD